MKYMALAVLLAVMQTSPPVPRKASDHPAKASRNVKHNRNEDKAPTTEPIPSSDSVATTPKQDTGSEIQRNDEQKPVRVAELPSVSIRTTWMDCLSLLFTGALVGVGVYGVLMARRTLNAIERQAKANEDQLMEIQQSGDKTDRMILLTAQQAEYGKISAETAKKSADALVNAERPWIVITPSPTTDGWSCTFDARNFGRTPAEIISTDAKFAIVDDGEDVPILSKEGKFRLAHRILMLPEAVDPIESKRSPQNVYVLHRNAILQGQTEEGRRLIALGQKRLIVYGIVVYEDVLTKGEHYTRFCYCFSPSGGDVIPAGPDGANEHT